jgi:hypothetical protein
VASGERTCFFYCNLDQNSCKLKHTEQQFWTRSNQISLKFSKSTWSFKIYLQKIEVLGINYIPVLHQPQLFWQLFCIKEMYLGSVQAHFHQGQFDAYWLESWHWPGSKKDKCDYVCIESYPVPDIKKWILQFTNLNCCKMSLKSKTWLKMFFKVINRN